MSLNDKILGTFDAIGKDVKGILTTLSNKMNSSARGAANGVAPLGSDSKIASQYLPTASGEASDPNAVKLTGDQTIAGNKTYTGELRIPLWVDTSDSTVAASTSWVRRRITNALSAATDLVRTVGDQTIAGVKAFNASPLVPDTTTSDQTERAINTRSARALINALASSGGSSDPNAVKLTGDQTIAGVKAFESSPLVPDTAANDQTERVINTRSVRTLINTLIDAVAVKKTGDHTIAGNIVFNISPLTPTPAENDQTERAANTRFVGSEIRRYLATINAVLLTGAQTIAGVKSFNSSPLVPDTATTDETERAINTRSAKALINAISAGSSSNDPNAVKLTGDQTVAGVKSFNASPLVPDTAAGDQTERAMNSRSIRTLITSMVDLVAVKLTGDQTIAGVKSFNSSPQVPDTPTANNSNNAVNTKSMLATISELFTWNNLKFIPGVLTNIGSTAPAVGQMYWVSSTAGAISTVVSTAIGRSLLAAASASAGRTTLGLGTISTQNANAVALTGGTSKDVTVHGIPAFASVTVTANNTELVRTGFFRITIDGSAYRLPFYPA